ncbi:MAG TPA: T9SS type A sorting domain-containing protein, partial [Bacteroidia bacterium]|nr:T9SS type A sorting domain-containing protein [Bacteroidia bacterium]
EILIDIETNGDTILSSYNVALSTIANQCPYEGGAAVYKAQALLQLLNDTIVFETDNTCWQNGYYRKAFGENRSLVDETGISIVPNPANEETTVILKRVEEGFCAIELNDVLGQLVFQATFNCADKRHKISTKHLKQGVYTLSVSINSCIMKKSKLIIVR